MFLVSYGENLRFFKGKTPPNPQTNKLVFTRISVPVAESVQYYLQ